MQEMTKPQWNGKKVLCIRLDRIGDLMVTTPAIHAIKEAYPDVCLHMLASKLNAPAVQCNPDIEKLFVYDKKVIFQFITLLRKLNKENYDAILTFTSGSKSSCFFTSHIQAQEKIAFAGAYNPKAFTHYVTEPATRHVLDTIKQSMENMGIPMNSTDLIFPIPSGAMEKIGAEYPKNGKFRLCLFIGNIKKIHNRWAPEKFVELGKQLQNAYKDSLEIMIMAGASDVPLLKAFENAPFPHRVYIGKDLQETGAFLQLCDALVASSSGPAHVASAVHCPICSLVTKYNEEVWRTLGEFDICITPETDITDMRDLEVDKVFHTLTEFIERINSEKIIPNFQSAS